MHFPAHAWTCACHHIMQNSRASPAAWSCFTSDVVQAGRGYPRACAPVQVTCFSNSEEKAVDKVNVSLTRMLPLQSIHILLGCAHTLCLAARTCTALSQDMG